MNMFRQISLQTVLMILGSARCLQCKMNCIFAFIQNRLIGIEEQHWN